MQAARMSSSDVAAAEIHEGKRDWALGKLKIPSKSLLLCIRTTIKVDNEQGVGGGGVLAALSLAILHATVSTGHLDLNFTSHEAGVVNVGNSAVTSISVGHTHESKLVLDFYTIFQPQTECVSFKFSSNCAKLLGDC